MIQLEEESYNKLKKYCEQRGSKLGPQLKLWIEEKTKRNVMKAVSK